MRTMILITMLSFLTASVFAGEGNISAYNAKHGELIVTIEGLPSSDGNLKVLLFNQETGFPTEAYNAIYNVDVNISEDGNSISFESIPYGEYALYVYHDENGNGKFDKNWAGAAREGYTYSNMINSKRTLPLYSQSIFVFEKDGTEMKLQVVPAK